jgi:WhiB family transcriptional regulator, redox-sensing transcriptional regulator
MAKGPDRRAGRRLDDAFSAAAAFPDEWRILPPLPREVEEGAACIGYPLSAFFANQGVVPHGRSICLVCPVKAPCLEYAMTHRVKGVWGGMTERDRDRLKAKRKKEDAEQKD